MGFFFACGCFLGQAVPQSDAFAVRPCRDVLCCLQLRMCQIGFIHLLFAIWQTPSWMPLRGNGTLVRTRSHLEQGSTSPSPSPLLIPSLCLPRALLAAHRVPGGHQTVLMGFGGSGRRCLISERDCAGTQPFSHRYVACREENKV